MFHYGIGKQVRAPEYGPLFIVVPKAFGNCERYSAIVEN